MLIRRGSDHETSSHVMELDTAAETSALVTFATTETPLVDFLREWGPTTHPQSPHAVEVSVRHYSTKDKQNLPWGSALNDKRNSVRGGVARRSV